MSLEHTTTKREWEIEPASVSELRNSTRQCANWWNHDRRRYQKIKWLFLSVASLVRRSATSSLALFRCSILPIQIMPIYIFIMIFSCERQFTCSLSQNQCHSTETIIKNSNIISAFIIGPGYLIYLFSSWNFKNFSSESQTIGMAKVRQCATGRISIIWPTSPIG